MYPDGGINSRDFTIIFETDKITLLQKNVRIREVYDENYKV